MIYYRRFPGDYLIDTLHLSWLEDCAYTRLLDYQYKTESVIPGLAEAIRITRAGTEAEREATKVVFERYFPHGWNSRASQEIEQTTVRAEIARKNGQLGGRPKNPEITQVVTEKEPIGLAKANPEKAIQTPDSRLKKKQIHPQQNLLG